MIVEVREYTIKPGLRAKFIEFFETRAVPAQREIGMEIMGPLLDIENPDCVRLASRIPLTRRARPNEDGIL
jgi:hypothetical protein